MNCKLFVFSLFAFCFGTISFFSAVPARAAPQATITVQSTSDGSSNTSNCPGINCRLRDAIAAANIAGGDTIAFSVTLPNKITLANGELVITKSLTLSGPGISLTVSGANSSRVFNISNGANVTITNLTIRDGKVTGGSGGLIFHSNSGMLTLTNTQIVSGSSSGASGGGGIFHANGKLNIMATTIFSNTSNSGGGLFIESGTVTVTNSTVSNNASSTDGGGIYHLNGTAYISNTYVFSNTGQNGGGIANTGTLTLTKGALISNTSTGLAGGGGIYNTLNGVLRVTDTTFMSNIATTGNGAGLHNSSSGNSIAIVSGSTFDRNSANGSASEGGGINNGGTLTLTNSTLGGNLANFDGGGIATNGTTYLNNVTITNNTADSTNTTGGDGGGISKSGGNLYYKNSIIAGNLDASGERPDCAGTATSQGYNLIGNITGCSFSTTTGDQVGGNGNPVIDPRLAPLGIYGGSTKTHMLLVNSPAINAGNPAAPGGGGDACMATDQRGVSRPIGSACDIGAYEGTPVGLFLPLIMK